VFLRIGTVARALSCRVTPRIVATALGIATLAGSSIYGATIALSTYNLLPNTPDQTINIMVSGGDVVTGVVLYVTTGDGSQAHLSPVITDVNILPVGGVFSGNDDPVPPGGAFPANNPFYVGIGLVPGGHIYEVTLFNVGPVTLGTPSTSVLLATVTLTTAVYDLTLPAAPNDASPAITYTSEAINSGSYSISVDGTVNNSPAVVTSASYFPPEPQLLTTKNPGFTDGVLIVSGTAAPTPTPTPSQTPTPPGPTAIASGSTRLINISTRAQVGTGANILIPGFVVGGTGTETLLIRADGPALTAFGVAGVLAQPSLTVFDSSGNMVASNTGWGTNTNPAQIASAAASVGAFALTSGSADCALIASLPAGAYTVQVSGVGNSTGVALAEVYEVSATGTRLVNISTRAEVGTGANIIIPGFVIAGTGSDPLLARGDGPALTAFGVSGVLTQPSLSLFDSSGNVIASNTGWGTSSNPAQIASAAVSVGAFALPSGSADSAQIVNLSAGAYTMQVSGVGNSTGVALAEVYEVR
jgi:hypothetical protein